MEIDKLKKAELIARLFTLEFLLNKLSKKDFKTHHKEITQAIAAEIEVYGG